jgi:hypothetical protein
MAPIANHTTTEMTATAETIATTVTAGTMETIATAETIETNNIELETDVEERDYAADDEQEAPLSRADKADRRHARAMRRLKSDWFMGYKGEEEEHNMPFLVASYERKKQRKLTSQEKEVRRRNPGTLKKEPWWEDVSDYTGVSSGEEEDAIHAKHHAKMRKIRRELNRRRLRRVETLLQLRRRLQMELSYRVD